MLADDSAATLSAAASREHFLEAQGALERRDFGTFRAHFEALEGHPLQVVLEARFLSARLESTGARVIEGFIDRNGHAVVSRQLERRWLYHLGRSGRWQDLLRRYRPGDGDMELACLVLQGRLATGTPVEAVDAEIERAWLSGGSRPDACDPLFDAWHLAGLMTPARVWARIELVMDRGRTGLARWLARKWLPAAGRARVDAWIAVHEAPQAELLRLAPVDDGLHREMVLDGIVQLARADPRAAWALWPAVVRRHELPPAAAATGRREVALRAAWDHLPEGLRWLTHPDIDASHEHVREWRIRAALRAGDWAAALQHLDALPAAEQHNPRWRYWRARALEGTGRVDSARSAYRELAGMRQYYGFLSADRIGRAYAMENRHLEADEEALARLRGRAAFRLAMELRRVGEDRLARQQWNWALRGLDEAALRSAAVLASRLSWPDRAIVAVTRSRHDDDLGIRFPLAHLDAVRERARAAGVDTAWVLGMIRQESGFTPDAVSRVGARGLMQLMPDTARRVASAQGWSYRGVRDLEDPDRNIALGTAYLNGLARDYAGNQALASAAYNAGPHRVREWLPREAELDADVWVETIPYRETRNFVKNVLSFAAVYDYRLGIEPTPLSSRMPPVPPARS